jgi:hypothetical protein
MGIWVELGVFGFVFAWHRLRDLKKERRKREKQHAESEQSVAHKLNSRIASSKPLSVSGSMRLLIR